jgi:hypothetical protein
MMREDPISNAADPIETAERGVDEEVQLSVEPLQEAKPDEIVPRLLDRATGALQSRPNLARALSLAVLVVFVLAITAAVLQPSLGALFSRMREVTPGGQSSVDISLQVHKRIIQPGEGWIPAGPSEAQHIVFAPSAPNVAYTCGAPGFSSETYPVPIAIEISSDHGSTWHYSQTPALGVQCDVTVDPTDAADVALAAIADSTGRSATPAAVTLAR